MTAQAPPPPDSDVDAPRFAGALRGTVVRGSFWLMGNSLITRGASFLTQIALGALLGKEDFGVYALAISVSALSAVLKDAGARQILIQRQREYSSLVGPVFWMAAAFNAATGAGLIALSPFVAQLYSRPELIALLAIIGISQPLSTPGAILATRLQIDLRFRALAAVSTVSAGIRYGGTVVLALLDFGPLSFVLPLPAVAVAEWALGAAFVRERPWQGRPTVSVWPKLLQTSYWLLLGSLGIAAYNTGASLVIGLFLPTAVVGVYFFAVQIVLQIGALVSANVFQVLVAAFAKISDDHRRAREGALRSLRQVALLSSVLCLAIVAGFPALEQLIWRGKWADATVIVQILGVLYPGTIVSSVGLAVAQANGCFRAYGLSLAWVASLSLSGAAAAGAISGSAWVIALSSGLCGCTGSLVVTIVCLGKKGIAPLFVLRAVAPSWLSGIAAAGMALALDAALCRLQVPLPGNVRSLARLCGAGVVFGLAFVVPMRALCPGHLIEMVLAMPSRGRRLLQGMLLLTGRLASRGEADSQVPR